MLCRSRGICYSIPGSMAHRAHVEWDARGGGGGGGLARQTRQASSRIKSHLVEQEWGDDESCEGWDDSCFEPGGPG